MRMATMPAEVCDGQDRAKPLRPKMAWPCLGRRTPPHRTPKTGGRRAGMAAGWGLRALRAGLEQPEG